MPTVKLFANLRKLAGMNEISITTATLGAALTEVVKRSPALEHVIFENGKLCPHVIVTLNGHPITEFETPVTEEDNVAIFPPIAGGTSKVGE